jgi:hypothetical protein
MRFLGRLLILVLVLSGLTGSVAGAERASVSQSITLNGIVPEAKYIELDSSGSILRIISNSNQDSEVHFYIRDGKNTPVTPTESQLAAFNAIKARFNLNKLGVVYESAIDSKLTQAVVTVSNIPDNRQISVSSSLQAATFVFY